MTFAVTTGPLETGTSLTLISMVMTFDKGANVHHFLPAGSQSCSQS
jgi:hypothetical protein